MLSNNPYMAEEYRCPGQEQDVLFEASYSHAAGDTCIECNRSRLVRNRQHRKDDRPRIHYGNIASGDEVVKDGPTRDRVARKEGILCFEMEDSHKNKQWQAYAAATAACYANELLGEVDCEGVEGLGLASK
jgi:hypothetical protein